MRHAAAARFPKLADVPQCQRWPQERGTQSFTFENCPPCNKFKNRHVRSVSIRNKNAAETMMRDTLGHVENEMKQVFYPYVDCAVKIHMVCLVSERDDGHQKDISFGALRGRFTDRPDEK